MGERIDYALRTKGIPRADLCKKVGITEAALSRYVTDKREPRAVTLNAIAHALNMSVDELLGNDPKPSDDELDESIRLVARSVKKISKEQKEMLVKALLNV